MSNLILGKDVLTDWKIYPLDIDGAIAGGWPQSSPALEKEPSVGPAFYMGTLQPNGLAWDTFLKLSEWTKVKPVVKMLVYNTMWVYQRIPKHARVFRTVF